MPRSVLDFPSSLSSVSRPASRAQTPARRDSGQPRFEVTEDSASSRPRPDAIASRQRDASRAPREKDVAPDKEPGGSREVAANRQAPEPDAPEAASDAGTTIAAPAAVDDAKAAPPETAGQPDPAANATSIPELAATLLAEASPVAGPDSLATRPEQETGPASGPRKTEDRASSNSAEDEQDIGQAASVMLQASPEPAPAMAIPVPTSLQVPQGSATEDMPAKSRPAPLAAMPVASRQALAERAQAAPGAGVESEAKAKGAANPAPDQGAMPAFGEHLAKATLDAGQSSAGQSIVPSAAGLPAPSAFLSSQPNAAQVPPAAQNQQASGSHPVLDGVPVAAVPVEIGLKSLAGINRFDIRLTPDDLGQIEIRLDISEEGRVKAHIVVERPDALVSLQRETPQLERALSQAGLSSGQDGISMSLRQQNQDGAGSQDRRAGPPGQAAPSRHDEPEAPAAPIMRRYSAGRATGIDRHV